MSPSRFKQMIIDELMPSLLGLKPERLKLGLSIDNPPKYSYLPLRSSCIALISIWCSGQVLKQAIPLLSDSESECSGYVVDEALPVAYDKTWPDGEQSPGVTLLTLMKKNCKLDQEAFIQEWYGKHTPLAMKIHPLWNYTRNLVLSSLDQQDYQLKQHSLDGIVEEHFKKSSHPLNPRHMFGGYLSMIPNMIKISRHVKHFLDLSNCQNYLLSETWYKS